MMTEQKLESKDAEAKTSEIDLGGRYLSFRLHDEEYGIDVLKVQEIIGLTHCTRVPRLPEYVKGVINLRGKVVPVVDLRLKFGMPVSDSTDKVCIVVVEVTQGATQLSVGLVVDEVVDVDDVDSDQVSYAPPLGMKVDAECMLGIAQFDERIVLLLDIETVLAPDQLRALGDGSAGEQG